VAEHVIPTEASTAEIEGKQMVAAVPAVETKTVANIISVLELQIMQALTEVGQSGPSKCPFVERQEPRWYHHPPQHLCPPPPPPYGPAPPPPHGPARPPHSVAPPPRRPPLPMDMK
jgi:hypothetical protein